MPPGARVLDLGCGERRDGVYFASRGNDVTGLDVSAAGLEKAERLANERGVTVRWLCRSMLNLPVAGRLDLVYSCGSIHHVPKDARPQLFRPLGTLSRPGGLHAHIVFTDVLKYPEKGEEIDYFALGELGDSYAAWLALRYEEGLIACSQDGMPHSHSIEQLVASMAWGPSPDRSDGRPPNCPTCPSDLFWSQRHAAGRSGLARRVRSR
jgi:tellurite methyltransferase